MRLRLRIKENIVFGMFFCFMAIYYLFHLVVQTPWYDELYTYYSFISKGPIYSAIHWPLPNNHVLYSVLSSFLDWFGNSQVGLRGVSYLSALLNIVLLYRLSQKFFSTGLSVICVCFYSTIGLVNTLAIQGRGYTFSITCYLMALTILYHLCIKPYEKISGWITYKWKLIFFSISLTAGLYAIPSNLYWVIPVCMVGGLYLLVQKRVSELFWLIGSALFAVIQTTILYGVIWLAIGANLLSKDIESEYYGLYQLNIVLQEPVASLKKGMEYMLETPYIQSVSREEVVGQFGDWLKLLLNQFYNGVGEFYIVILCTSLFFLIIGLYKKRFNLFLSLFLVVTLIMFPVILVVQSVLPYQRVFSYLGIFVALLLTYCCSMVRVKSNLFKNIYVMAAVSITVIHLCSPAQNISYGAEEERIYKAFLQMDIESIDTIFYTDDYQKYILKYYWDLEPQEVALEEADCVLVSKEILREKHLEIPIWPALYTYKDLSEWDMEEYFDCKIDSEGFILYYKEKF